MSLNWTAVNLWRVDGDHLLAMLNGLGGAIGSALYLHTIDGRGYSLDLWLRRLFNGWLGLLALPVEVAFILQFNSVRG